VQLKLATHGRAQTVEELADLQATRVVLHVAWVEVVSDVEDGDTGASALIKKGDLKALEDLRIKREIHRKTSGLILRADYVKPLIDQREWKAGANLQRWRDRDFPPCFYFSVGKKTMRHVERKRSVLVRPNDESRKIAKKIVRRVQIAARL